MNKYTCWSSEFARKVMNTEALQVDDDVFLATHQPQVVRVEKSDVKGRFKIHKGSTVDEQGLLTLLLAPDEDHMQVAVVGASGSGKSHLVRWLYLNIPQSESYEVVLIPKSANLEQVIETFVAGRQGEIYERIRKELKKAPIRQASDDEIREKLMNELCMLVGPLTQQNVQGLSGAERDTREILTEHLPALLYDPEFRKSFLDDQPTMDGLVQHVRGEERARVDRRQEFSASDFDVKRLGVESHNLSRPAWVMFERLANDPDMKDHVARWMTQNLDAALARLVGLGSGDLQLVLGQIRRELRAEGRELILLIEDLARTQGIDRQILAAVSERPKGGVAVRGEPDHGDKEVCVLRSVVASTRDYYMGLHDTILQRTAVIVDMEVNYSIESARENSEAIVDFASRYLNAVRLGTGNLRAWYDGYRNSQIPVSCACDGCDHADECRRAFGCVRGVGLYPFNAIALQRMYVHKDPETRRRFNPRDLINKVLEKVLYFDTDIQKGQFPSQALLDEFGGSDLPLKMSKQLQIGFPVESSRYVSLLTFWRKSDNDYDVPEGVYQAFGLQSLAFPEETESEDHEEPTPPQVQAQPSLTGVPKHMKTLNDWVNKDDYLLPDSFVNSIREKLFKYIRSHIDWNYEMLREDFYSGTGGKPFRVESIDFKRQHRLGGQAPVSIGIPAQDTPTKQDYVNVALALQGLLQYEHNGSWGFDGESMFLRPFMQLLDTTSNEVLSQIRKLNTESEPWDPVPATVELLYIGLHLRGKFPIHTIGTSDVVNMLFGLRNWTGTNAENRAFRSQKWNDLVEQFRRSTNVGEGGNVVDILLSRVACSKGSDLRQFIDASEVVRPLTSISKTLRLEQDIPKDVRVQYRRIQELHKHVERNLENAVLTEKRNLLELFSGILSSISGQPFADELTEVKIKEVFGGVTCTEAVGEVNSLLDAAFKAGAVAKPDIDAIKMKQACITDVDIDSVISCVVRLAATDDAHKCLPLVCDDGIVEQVTAMDSYLASVDTLLKELDASVPTGSVPKDDPRVIRTEIRERLQEISDMLEDVR